VLALPAVATPSEGDPVACQYYSASDTLSGSLEVTHYATSADVEAFRQGDVTGFLYSGPYHATAKAAMDALLLAPGNGGPATPSSDGDNPCASTSACEGSLDKTCVNQANIYHQNFPSLASCDSMSIWSVEGSPTRGVSCGCHCNFYGNLNGGVDSSIQCWAWHCNGSNDPQCPGTGQ
jgi:hypothetical protein